MPVLKRHFSDIAVFASQVILLIAFICVQNASWTDYSAYTYFEVVTMCDLIMILIFYLIHLFRFYRVLTCISWPLSVRDAALLFPGRSLGIGWTLDQWSPSCLLSPS